MRPDRPVQGVAFRACRRSGDHDPVLDLEGLASVERRMRSAKMPTLTTPTRE